MTLSLQESLPLGIIGLHVTGQMTVGEIAVAVGTLALAFFTFRSVRVARAHMDAQDAPLIIAAPVPANSPIVGQFAPFEFDPPFAGLLPDGYSPRFALRLRNVGRGPALVRDVRLRLDGRDALGPLLSQVIIEPDGVFDATWAAFSAPAAICDAGTSGRLSIVYASSGGSTFQTASAVDMRARALHVTTIDRRKLGRRGRRRLRACARSSRLLPAWSPSEAYLKTLRSWRRSRR